jgi:hypothetical protein
MHKKTFQEIETRAREAAQIKNDLLTAASEKAAQEEAERAERTRQAVINFFEAQNIDRASLEDAIALSSRNQSGTYLTAHFDIEGHSAIRVHLFYDNDKVSYDGSAPWRISSSNDLCATFGDALIESKAMATQYERWAAKEEAQEELDAIEMENQDQVIQAAIQAKLDAVRDLLDRHPDAWRMITMVALFYEVIL